MVAALTTDKVKRRGTRVKAELNMLKNIMCGLRSNNKNKGIQRRKVVVPGLKKGIERKVKSSHRLERKKSKR